MAANWRNDGETSYRRIMAAAGSMVAKTKQTVKTTGSGGWRKRRGGMA